MTVEYKPGPWLGGVGTMTEYGPPPVKGTKYTDIAYLSGGVRSYYSYVSGSGITPVTYDPTGARFQSSFGIGYTEEGSVFQYGFAVCTGYPAAPGLPYYEPRPEMNADPLAIGWQFPGSPIYLDSARCTANGVGAIYDEWSEWDDIADTSGYQTYEDWLNTHYVPMTSGVLRVDVSGSNTFADLLSPGGGGRTFLVGRPADVTIIGGKIYFTSVATSEVLDATVFVTEEVNGRYTIPLPPLTNLPEYGPSIISGHALSDISGAASLPKPDSPAVTRSAKAYAELSPYLTATVNEWRLLYVADETVEPNLTGLPVRKVTRFWD